MTHNQQPKRQGCLVVLGIIGILLLGTYGYQQFRVYRYTTKLYAVAEHFGYTPADQITQTLNCWDFTFFLEANCGPFLMFTTKLNHDDLRSVIVNAGLRIDPWDPSSLSVSELFTDMRFQTNKTLTWAAKGNIDTFSLQQKILAVDWSVEDQEGGELYIYFYETSAVNGNLVLDGQPLLDNIISIQMYIGLLPTWLPLR